MSDNSASFLRLYLGVVSYHLDLTCFSTVATVKYIGETAVYHNGFLRVGVVHALSLALTCYRLGLVAPLTFLVYDPGT